MHQPFRVLNSDFKMTITTLRKINAHCSPIAVRIVFIALQHVVDKYHMSKGMQVVLYRLWRNWKGIL